MKPEFKEGDQFIDTQTPHRGVMTVVDINIDEGFYGVTFSTEENKKLVFTREIGDPFLRKLTKLERVLA